MVVEPILTPVTTPDVLIVATEGLLLVQVPPAAVSVSVTVDPTQTPLAPVTGPGEGNILSVTRPDILSTQPVVVLVPVAV